MNDLNKTYILLSFS